MITSDCNIFVMPINTRIKGTRTNQVTFLIRDTKRIIRKSIRNVQLLMKNSQDIRTYFPVAPPPDRYPAKLPTPE